MYDALAVANHFLELAGRDDRKIDPMKIQKLVYFAHGWHLALVDEPLIRERIEAWDYGPVIPVLYQSFRKFGSSPITEKGVELKIQGGSVVMVRPKIGDPCNSGDDDYAKALLENVWETYKDYSALQLSSLTHRPESPWQIARTDGARAISDELIKSHFKREFGLEQ